LSQGSNQNEPKPIEERLNGTYAPDPVAEVIVSKTHTPAAHGVAQPVLQMGQGKGTGGCACPLGTA